MKTDNLLLTVSIRKSGYYGNLSLNPVIDTDTALDTDFDDKRKW
jgi:hypothetical protein